MVFCLWFGSRPKPDKKMEKKDSTHQNRREHSSSSSVKTVRGTTSDSETQQVSQSRRGQIFTYRELATATKNFRLTSLVGRGGFGSVFKGTIKRTGQDVAVKMLDKTGLQGDKEFLVEVLMLSLVRHENLVKLIGYCAEGDQRLLVYEYMPLGSVEDHIHNRSPGQEALDWSTRMQIAAGAAKGIAHLHNEAKPPVIYRDLKTANILLDHGFKAKLSDFGLAKFGPTGDRSHVSTRVMGTHGYCAPEYANSGKLTMKSDIYSFGVVMLELITGRKALLNTYNGQKRYLVNWALPLFMDNKIKQIVDPTLIIKGRYMESTLVKALEVAFMCLREEANARPSISEVVAALDYIVKCITKQKMKATVGGGRGGVDLEKKGTTSGSSPEETAKMLNVDEVEDEESKEFDREKAVAAAKHWAENLRGARKQSSEPPTAESIK